MWTVQATGSCSCRSSLARRRSLDGVGSVRANVLVLCEKSRATILLRDRDPAAGLARDLPLGRLQDPPGARCLACRAIMLLELANRPAQRRSLPTSTTNTARCNAGVVECPLGLLPTSRATPHHSCRLYPRRRRLEKALKWSSVNLHEDERDPERDPAVLPRRAARQHLKAGGCLQLPGLRPEVRRRWSGGWRRTARRRRARL